MRVTALDIHQKEFTHGVRGYKESEVDDFLDSCAAEVDLLSKEKKTLAVEVERLKAIPAPQPVPVAAPVEASPVIDAAKIGDVLLIAQKTAEGMISEANAKAMEIARKAEAKATEIVREAMNQKDSVVETIKHLKREESTFRDRYKAVLSTALDSISEIKLPSHVVLEEKVLVDSAPDDVVNEPVAAPVAAPVTEVSPPENVSTPVAEIKAAAPVHEVPQAPDASHTAPYKPVADAAPVSQTTFTASISVDDDLEIEEID